MSGLSAFRVRSETAPISAVTILNPYNPAELVGGEETIVYVKATDSEGVVYPIDLPAPRRHPLPRGARLPPSLRGDGPSSRLVRSPQRDIHVLELRKLGPLGTVDPVRPLDAEARWLYFLKEGRRWAILPAALQSPEMRKAMSVLERFSDAQRDLALYQSRVDYLHVQRTLEVEREEDAARLAELEAALVQVQAEKERVQAEKEHERAEKERFRRLLLAAGIDPDTSSN